MKNKFIVAIGRDPALLSYCHPDLIITTDRVNCYDQTPTIFLSDFLGTNKFLGIYDTDLTSIIDQENKKFQEYVLKEIKAQSKGRPVLISLYYNAYTNILRERGFEVIGPSDQLAYRFSSKKIAYQLALDNEVPVAPGELNLNLEQVKDFFNNNPRGIFLAEDKDPYHPNNLYISDSKQLSELNPESKYLVSTWLNNVINSPNTQVIIGPKKIFYLGITDQIIKNGVQYYGNHYPCASKNQEKIKEYTLTIARVMQTEGYRGISGFDWIETEDDKIFFAEINPRKNRSSAMLSSFLNHYRPSGAPTIFELEIMASQNKDWNIEPWSGPLDIHWSMEVVRIFKTSKIKEDIIPACSEENIFQFDKKQSIVNFPPKNKIINPGCPDIARIITVGGLDNHQSLEQINKSLEQI